MWVSPGNMLLCASGWCCAGVDQWNGIKKKWGRYVHMSVLQNISFRLIWNIYTSPPPHSGTQKNTVYGKSFAEQERLTFKTRPGCAKLHIGESLQRKEICINFKSFNFRWFIQVLLCKAKPPPPPADLVIVFNFLQSAQTMPHSE